MTDPSRVGTVVAGKYRLDEELGRGGMGAVYRAYHLRVHKDFAIKVLLSEVVEHRSIASRFFLEAQAAGRIGHPGILDVYDVGEDADGTPFIVMELLRGEALSTLVRRERVDVDAACWIAMEVLDVLEAAHRAGIIHRDVKPQNVFVTEKALGDGGAAASSVPPKSGDPTPVPGSGVTRGVKLLDFGVAKFGSASGDISALTRSGEIIGSPLYMAPEQAKGEADLDPRADLWSVGAMLFEMLTGKCAHAATTPVAVLAKILTEQAPAPSTRDDRVPPELDLVVEKALRIDRTQRYASAQEMRDALHEVRKKRGTADKAPIIPPAAKRSIPPAPTDLTPGAITSTVAAPSDPPPKRPWSSRPRVGGDVGSAVGPHTPPETSVSPAVKRSRVLLGAGAGIAAVALVSWYLVTHNGSASTNTNTNTATSSPTTTTTTTPTDVPAVAPASASTSAVATTTEPSTSATASASAAAAATESAAPPTSVVVPSKATATAPTAVAAPKCAAGEVLSKGHCCVRGLEWQNGHCERPLATTF